ncbi:MAG TPA: Gfo/Idh/MocA family oxidoreductase, partial [Abditibacteriaceae bacterium]|nr:Gfo/Idh/MocA family oxidoreductase [Abditibacteriaceae bacterium]
MNKSELKVGIIGARRGAAFMAGFEAAAETTVVALCDNHPQTLDDYADKYNIKRRYLDYEAMLESDLDIVVVATPMPLHVPMSVAALSAGKHVLSEVPAAIDLLQCWQLVQAVLSSGKKYMMAENCCYMKPAVLITELVRPGLFGELYFGEGEYTHELKATNKLTPWRRAWQTGRRGCTYATHSLGPLLQWFNAARNQNGEIIKVATVACFGSGHHYKDWRGQHFKNDDVNLMLCQLSNGGLVKIRNDLLSERPLKSDYNSLQGTHGCYEAPRGFGDAPKIWLASCHRPGTWHSLWDFEAEFMPEMWRNPSAEALRAGHGGSDY